MNFNEHSRLEGKHAFLSASKYSWLNYDEEKMEESYSRFLAAQKGTVLHAYAASSIDLKQKLPRSNKTINMYVNDAISLKMKTEQVLYYSENCFGTADAISFDKGTLRIHDYKSGVTPAKGDQLQIYAALFCLEYDINPNDISIELRIYQSDQIFEDEPDPEIILIIMSKIIEFDNIINRIKSKED